MVWTFIPVKKSFMWSPNLPTPHNNSLNPCVRVFNVKIAQHNAAAAAALNRNNQELSAAAPEFIPNFKPPNPSGDWNYQQETSQVYQPAQPHIYPPPQNHSRPFQQAPYQQRNFPVYPQQHQSNRNYRPDLIQNSHHSHHHHPQQQQNFSNHHQYMMMNQQHSHGHNNYPQQQQQQHGHDGYGMSSIQNRLNFNNSHQPEPVIPPEPMPHKQVNIFFWWRFN